MKSTTNQYSTVTLFMFAGLISLLTAAGVSVMLAPKATRMAMPAERYSKLKPGPDKQPRTISNGNKEFESVVGLSQEIKLLSHEVGRLRAELEQLKYGKSDTNESELLNDKISRSSQEEWDSYVSQNVQTIFTEHWDQEDNDLDWSLEREADIDEYFSGQSLEGVALHYAQCKKSLCKLELSVEDRSAHAEEGMTLGEILASRDTFGTAAQIIAGENGKKIVYLASACPETCKSLKNKKKLVKA